MKGQKKVLIITYYWPPAGGPGVQRWLKFAKYLPEFGWKPIIYTPENPSYPIVDETLLREVPKDIEIVRTQIWEPYQLAEKFNKSNKKFKSGQFDVGENQSLVSKLSIWVRGNFFIPDARKFWVKPSVEFLKKYLTENQIQTIVTTGPPHSLHLIGLNLKKENPNLKWIADFRDPWTEISYYKHLKLTKSSDKKHRELEKSVFQNADITLATSYTDAENFKKLGANAVCITNGFDFPSEVGSQKSEVGSPMSEVRSRKSEVGSPMSEVGKSEGREVGKSSNNVSTTQQLNNSTTLFTLSYVGVLEQLRNPEILWYIIYELLCENSEFALDFQLKFVGKVDPQILHSFRKIGIDHVVENLGYLPHDESVEEMLHSSILLLTNFPNDASKGIIPGKIFEYLSTGNAILSFGPKDADVEKILENTKAGKHFSYAEKAAVKDFILQKYHDWKSGNLNNSNADIQEFSRRNLTKKLADIL